MGVSNYAVKTNSARASPFFRSLSKELRKSWNTLLAMLGLFRKICSKIFDFLGSRLASQKGLPQGEFVYSSASEGPPFLNVEFRVDGYLSRLLNLTSRMK